MKFFDTVTHLEVSGEDLTVGSAPILPPFRKLTSLGVYGAQPNASALLEHMLEHNPSLVNLSLDRCDKPLPRDTLARFMSQVERLNIYGEGPVDFKTIVSNAQKLQQFHYFADTEDEEVQYDLIPIKWLVSAVMKNEISPDLKIIQVRPASLAYTGEEDIYINLDTIRLDLEEDFPPEVVSAMILSIFPVNRHILRMVVIDLDAIREFRAKDMFTPEEE